MGWADYPTEKVPKEVVQCMLDLVDRINYAYLQTDGMYGDLAYVVSDKVKLIERKLLEAKEREVNK